MIEQLAIEDRVVVTKDIHKGKTGHIIDHNPESRCGQWLVEFDGRTTTMKAFEGRYWCWADEISRDMLPPRESHL